MQKVIVTGANAFIGSALLQELSMAGLYIIAVVRGMNSNINKIKDIANVRIVYCDLDKIAELPNIVQDRDIDYCIHLAWKGSFGNERADYDLQLQNVKLAVDIIHVIAKMGIKRFIGAGTLAEKDVLNYHPTDGAVPNAVSNYGIAKITTHFMTKVECTKLGIEHIWCYISNTYGIGNTTGNFINFAILKMLKGERAAFTTGEQMYDFVYISDTAKGIMLAALKGKSNTAYYIGSTEAKPLKTYIKTIRDSIDKNIPLFLGEIPFNGIALLPEAYDCKKLVEDTGYAPKVTFEAGIITTIEWVKNNLLLEEGD